MKKQVHAVFRGRVQGVGFRYAALDIARSLEIQGWVQNRADGSVEVSAEGERELLEAFLRKLAERFLGYIRSSEVDWGEAGGGFDGFAIRS